MRPFAPLAWIAASVWLWLVQLPPSFLAENICFVIMWVGVLFFYATASQEHQTSSLDSHRRLQCQMVVASMAALPYELHKLTLLAPLPLLPISAYIFHLLGTDVVPPLLLLHVYAAVSVAVQAHYWSTVVREISIHLHIHVFSISKRL